MTVPSLSSAFQSLLKPLTSGFAAPSVPQTQPASAYMSVYKPAAPAIPNMSAYSPTSIPYSNAQANAVAAKGTVPYIPATATSGGKSLVPTSTSSVTGLPSSSVPGSVSPSTSRGYAPPAIPTISAPSVPAISSAPSFSTTTQPTTTPTAPSLPQADTSASTGAPSAPSAPGTPSGFSSSTSGGGVYSAGAGGGLLPTAPYGYDTSLSGGGSNPAYDPANPLSGLSLLYSPEQQAAAKAYQESLSMTPEEIAAQKRLNDLNTSASQAYTNASGQAIPLPFITGQQAQLQKEQATLAQPLESQLALLQAKRQLAGEASKTALDLATSRISALQELSKPVPTAYGGTLSRYNPATGKYETVVNPFGSASGTASGAQDTTQAIGQAIANGQITSDMVTRYGIPFISATLAADPGYNFITQKASVAANSASLKTQQGYVDTVTRAFNTANDNLSSLTSFMTKFGINQSNVPMVNQLQNKVKAGLTDAGSIAAFNSALSGLRAEYAQVLSRGGEVTDSARATATSLIPDNISPAQLQQVAERLNTEGTNAINEATKQVQAITSRTGSNTGSSSLPGGTSSSGSSSVGWY